jgi:hypothetical protein
MKLSAVLCIAAITAGCASRPAEGPSPEGSGVPRSGQELLARMHDRYAGKWFRTLTFVQATTMNRPDGTTVKQTWFESLRSPDRLRIDMGELAAKNGVLYTADSLYVIRGGKLVSSAGEGNPFLPFVAGVYTQPLDRTLAQVAPYHFDLGAIRDGEWRGRPVYIVGTRRAGDLSTSQFWIDKEHLLLVRALLAPPASGPGSTIGMEDFLLDGYVATGGGWLATRVTILIGGVVRQTEEYSDWRPNVDLPADLFEPARWSTAKHWAAGRDAR